MTLTTRHSVLSTMTWGIASHNGTSGLKPAQDHCSFQSLNVSSIIQFLYSCAGLHHVFWSGLLRKMFSFVNCLGDPDYSQKHLSSLKLRSPFSLPGVEVNIAFFITYSSLRSPEFCPSPLSRPPLMGCADQSHSVIPLAWCFVLPVKIRPLPQLTVLPADEDL